MSEDTYINPYYARLIVLEHEKKELEQENKELQEENRDLKFRLADEQDCEDCK